MNAKIKSAKKNSPTMATTKQGEKRVRRRKSDWVKVGGAAAEQTTFAAHEPAVFWLFNISIPFSFAMNL